MERYTRITEEINLPKDDEGKFVPWTVGELIKELEKFDLNAEVEIRTDKENIYRSPNPEEKSGMVRL